jgi:2,3-bisphosphoglycerate-dependent phosphoglycerate mutase
MYRFLLVILLIMQIAFFSCTNNFKQKPENSLRIFLARHGQTDWNAERRLQGWKDVELNDTGRRQAKELAVRLEGIHLDQVYSSVLRRSRETAEIAAGRIPIESLSGLNEQSFGIFEGKYLDGRDPETLKEYDRRKLNPDDSMDGGESMNQHFARVKATIDMIRSKHPSGQILIVGHGGTNSQILRALLDLTPEQTREIRQDNSELYLIELSQGKPPMVWKYIPKENLNDL